MADGKTVEEVAREIAEDNTPPYWLDGENVVDLSRLGGLIETALRQREQETASICRSIVAVVTEPESGAELGLRRKLLAEILSRFPKDQG